MKFRSTVGRQYLKLAVRLGLLRDALQLPLKIKSCKCIYYVLLCLSWATKLRNAQLLLFPIREICWKWLAALSNKFLVEIEIVRKKGT